MYAFGTAGTELRGREGSMDQAIRNKLRSVVTQCRKLLEESIAQQLQGK